MSNNSSSPESCATIDAPLLQHLDVELQQAAAILLRISNNVGRAVIGRSRGIELLLVALLCDGHVLLEDVPGTGKTLLAKAMSRSLGLSFRRIQCTPDLLPSDVTGSQVFDQRSAEFVFRPGPLFAHVILVDEVNRATPRTQAALLEAMEERQVTVDGVTRSLGRPFFVLATQNPVEFEGTFPLPEAQLDRFLMCVSEGYPQKEEEDVILRKSGGSTALETLEPVVMPRDIELLRMVCDRVHVADDVRNYLLTFVRATRGHPQISLGASPRAGLALLRSAQALACLRGRGYVEPDDIKELAWPVLGHRVMLAAEARVKARDVREILNEILDSVSVPVEEKETQRIARYA